MDKYSMDPELVDRIYECSLVPELWPGVLDELGRISGAEDGGAHFISKAGLQYWTASAESWERTERAAKEGWFGRGQFAARFFAKRHAGFLTEFDFLTPEEFDQEPINRDFWRPQGL